MPQFVHCMNLRKNNQIDMKLQYGVCLRMCVIFLISRKYLVTLMCEKCEDVFPRNQKGPNRAQYAGYAPTKCGCPHGERSQLAVKKLLLCSPLARGECALAHSLF